ncbi:helix-turn-helix transcriptional regulator [Acinetobacter rongchengensis]|uniref:AlpA family phage regulatory protein n=1 Tax=Acinetobacter rongchengensis TaxID=2419601 RepID=A0A3A8F5Q6_9GAMM|nr:AlpA family transcriptional regulator [Acinetobacter rongchengensis]RKG36491.1 AlpA family phage regulatory protein [Acinetobacter rongchengensis]
MKDLTNTPNSLRLIRRKEVQLRTGLGASSIYALMQKNQFPKPVTLSIRRVAWVESDVEEWILNRISQKQK